MNLTETIHNTLNANLADRQAALASMQATITQAEVFSDKLIQERLLSPLQTELATFTKAFKPLGGLTTTMSPRIDKNYYGISSLILAYTAKLPPGELQELFDTFLTCATDYTYMNTQQVIHSRSWRLANIKANLYISCRVPSAHLDLLKSIGKIQTTPGTSYDSIVCGDF